ncbi:hypothetical protein Q8W15_04865 [Photobacterium damselae subsp. piscicida]|uniref:hypothetical protein n=1 Tax=Photobacterium damselae TaxID=38293 RepID=UPI001D138319|nr:hypothetical protein [Photobacterium damselae]MDP2515969.1 hypothetical protein [Photobacterium damselae subsp. piscicida]MDP2533856.1 hypothetical protein [Photobacterium damselae subsp. piscicida]MDP2543783.1 hypothetical protein [Photobacterium damselae subsp. piscicida]MDP2556844.1 hypothetical protein [Photobacterium damselae subsp. piscicida]MDP2567273.1 hypothetical protein [Photobacterium damselae subsp. piscicida]
MFAHKLVGNIRLTDIAQALNTKNWTLARDCLDTLNAFMCSADDQILYDHFERADTGSLLTTKQERYVIEVVQSAEDMCGDMNNKTLKKATLALALIASMPNISVAEDSRPGFYDRKAEGWFFYEVEPEEKEVPKPKPVAVQPPPPPPEQEQMAQSEGPEYFSAA